HGEAGGVRVVDDYGHHPTEVAAAIETARLGAPGRVIVVFQPHRYTRTLRLRERFGPALALADAVILTEVYAAGESPVAGATSGAIAAAVRAVSAVPVRCVETLDAAAVAAAGTARRGDVVLTLGAGTVGTIAPRILRSLEERAS
ncbi:MAG: UDP-N-acetylmuramate--L-alanine ligase, partial [Acidobacteria bacterium]|nr:UDP-N-acetylmuramate--L-alanine ligase [Acidobacteriota bacterium]